MTNEEINDMKAIFNAEDSVASIEKRDVIINGVTVTCWDTGLTERTHRRTNKKITCFGLDRGHGYLAISCNGNKTNARSFALG